MVTSAPIANLRPEDADSFVESMRKLSNSRDTVLMQSIFFLFLDQCPQMKEFFCSPTEVVRLQSGDFEPNSRAVHFYRQLSVVIRDRRMETNFNPEIVMHDIVTAYEKG